MPGNIRRPCRDVTAARDAGRPIFFAYGLAPVSPPLPRPPTPRVSLRARLRANARYSASALGLVWRTSPRGVVALGIFTIAAAALPPAVAYVGKLIVDAVM